MRGLRTRVKHWEGFNIGIRTREMVIKYKRRYYATVLQRFKIPRCKSYFIEKRNFNFIKLSLDKSAKLCYVLTRIPTRKINGRHKVK